MTKKKYIIIAITTIAFIIIISLILLKNNNQKDWKNEILNSDNYEMTMEDCNSRKITIPKEKVPELFNKWNNLSNNGPWTGNNNLCYTKVNILYEKNSIIKTIEIILIDDTSLVLIKDNNSTYYTNSSEINNYLNNLFIEY
ncbi:MAG: hypothetical protein ACI31S_02990 [Bacilli bacterium]